MPSPLCDDHCCCCFCFSVFSSCSHLAPLRRSQNCEYELVTEGIEYRVTAKNLVRLVWEDRPRTVLIIKKPNDAEISGVLAEIAAYLHSLGLTVMVEPAVHADTICGASKLPYLQTWPVQASPDQVCSAAAELQAAALIWLLPFAAGAARFASERRFHCVSRRRRHAALGLQPVQDSRCDFVAQCD